MLAPYRRILRTPHLPSLLGLSLLARLCKTGMALALTFLVAGWTGSYALAGVVTAAEILGAGVGGPLRGRLVDRRPAPRILVLAGAAYFVGMALLAVLPAAWWPVAVPLAFAAGLASPPANQVARMLWSRLPEHETREAAFAADATLQELLFIAGPMLAAVLVATINARAAVAACGVLALLGSVAFAVAVHRSGLRTVGEPAGDAGTRRRASVLRSPGVLPVLIVMFLVVAALGSGDMLMTAWARDRGDPGLAGVFAAVWAIGSGAGGLVVGGRAGPQRLVLRVAAAAVGLALLVPVLPPVLPHSSPWLVCVVLLVGGSTIAPTMAAISSRLGALAPDERRGEAFGWLTTAGTAGGAAASPVVGALLDGTGPAVAAGFAALVVTVGIAVARLVPAATPQPHPAPDAASVTT